MLLRWGFGLLLVALVGCTGGSITANDSRVPDAPSSDTQADARADSRFSDTIPNPSDAQPDGPVPGPVALRGLFHVHSVYSHDACDDKGFISGSPNLQCLADLRGAVCNTSLDFVYLTDHPNHMKNYTLEEDLLFDPVKGDVLEFDAQNNPIANRMACPGGGSVLVSVGYEGSPHMMPVGLHQVPTDPNLEGVTNADPIATVQAQVAALQAMGAVVSLAHSEEDDLSAATIVAGGFDAMEWYNPHGNIGVFLGPDLLSVDIANIPAVADLIGKLVTLDDFLIGSTSGVHPDLIYLLLVQQLPIEGFDKWRVVNGSRPVTGMLGSDVHQNVNVDVGLCEGAVLQLLCDQALNLAEGALGFAIPQSVRALFLAGGNIVLTDNDRFDSYKRVMRWLENRVFADNDDLDSITDAVRAGRLYGLFSVFGEPDQFYFSASGGTLRMGDGAQGPLTLDIRLPAGARSLGAGGVPFTNAEGDTATVTMRLYRTTSGGTALVKEVVAQGQTVSEQVSVPGAYHVELSIRPNHLSAYAPGRGDLINADYLWIISNPIRVLP